MFSWLLKIYRNAPLPIAVKWTMAFSTLSSVIMATLGWFLIDHQHRIHMGEMQAFGRILVEQLAHSASEPLLADDQFNLQGLVNRQIQSGKIVGAAVVGDNGLREASGMIPADLGNPEQTAPLIWSWSDDKHNAHPAITFSSPIVFRDVAAGYALLTLDREFFDRQKEQTIRSILYATVSLILISGLLSYLLSRRLSRPITALAKAGSQRSPFNLADSVDVGRSDEIGQVYAHFERMTAGLLEKRQVEEALSRYVSPVVAGKILSNLSQQRLANQDAEGTILFCDIVGFTELSEDLASDAVAKLLNLYLGAVAEAAHRCQGFVDKFIGDSAMILFGIPDENPLHAQYAIRCAWLIQALVEHINRGRKQQGDEPIKLRIGINSGRMLAGNIGTPDRLEYTVVGDTVNLASRLCGLAPIDGILLGETTAAYPGVSEMGELHSQPPIRVRGRKNPVTPAIVGTPATDLDLWLDESTAKILSRSQS
jgi:adenylate cyclase